jgi:hypothetical protein
MSEDCDCEHEEEEQDEEEGASEEPTRQVEMMAGNLFISAEGEDTDEAVEGAKELWDKALGDVENMNQEDRRKIGLQ